MKIAQCEERKKSANGSLPLVNEVDSPNLAQTENHYIERS